MNHLEKFKKMKIDMEIISRHPNDWTRRKYLKGIISKEFLDEVVNFHKFSMNFIAQNILQPRGIKMSAAAIIYRCKTYGIDTPTMVDSANNPKVRNKFKETCDTRYGMEHPMSKNSRFYKKRNKTVKNRYNIANVFQLESTKEKSKETLMTKYGVTNTNYLPNRPKHSGYRSKLQIIVEDMLKELNIEFEYEPQHRFFKFNKKLNREFCPRPDILIESKKIVIEINGDIWHGNPKIYKATDIIPIWGGNKTAREIRKKDKIRIHHIEDFGYKVIVLWELDIRKNPDKIKKIINENCKN